MEEHLVWELGAGWGARVGQVRQLGAKLKEALIVRFL